MPLALQSFVPGVILYATCISCAAVTLEFKGQFERRTDSESIEMLGDTVCFYPNAESAKFLPRQLTDRRLPWFCFANTRRAMQLLRIPSASDDAANCGFFGRATVRVTYYEVYSGEGDGFDTALLDAVVRSSKPELLPCK